MRKIILAISALCGAFVLVSGQSSESLIKTIAAKAAAHTSYSDRFTEVRTPAKTADGKTSCGEAVVTLEGKLDYKSSGYLSMAYDNKDLFLIDGNLMTIIRDGKPAVKFDTSKNLMMRGLQHALLYSFSGKLSELATEQKADLNVVTVKEGYEATLTATKKQARGYSRIIVRYSPGGSIIQMQMDEFSGASTFYKFL